MMMRDERLLEKLTQIWGVAGFESAVREAIEEIVKPYADEMWTDAVGNLIVLKKGTEGPDKKKIMDSAHMDQMGFIVKNIDCYSRSELPIGAVGSIAWYYRDLFREVVLDKGYVTGVIVKSPMEGLVRYHACLV